MENQQQEGLMGRAGMLESPSSRQTGQASYPASGFSKPERLPKTQYLVFRFIY
ncbi:hypothetical protein [Nostoc sp. CENA543]|uniref:hypothetical protein n=1 Tax=Nostoc sp. CENA543 TaxID=1869241 RepID=UPI0013001020|nr:hypothetical protein [Nostoc sp. CENA543]